MPKLLGIGINTMDIYRHEKRMYPGGNEFNIAYHAAKNGTQAAFMGVFTREDPLSLILYHTLEEAGVDLSHSHFQKGTSGFAIVDLVKGDRVFVDWNKKGVTDLYPFVFTPEEISYINTFDIVCLSRCARVDNQKVVKLAQSGAAISYDFCDYYTKEDIICLSPYLKFAFLSGSHLSETEVKDLLREITARGTETAVATRGEKPAIAFDGKEFYYQKPMEVKAVDTMGAGDSFISRFLTAYLDVGKNGENADKGAKIKNALSKAASFAAEIVQKRGSLGVGYEMTEEQTERILQTLKGGKV